HKGRRDGGVVPSRDATAGIPSLPVVLLLTGWRDFWQNIQKPRCESGRGRVSRQLLFSFRPAVAELTNRGEQRGCFMKTKTSLTTDSINLSPLRCALLLISLVFACFGLSPAARAICQEGCDLAHNNTFLGDDALTSNTTGILNTATGADALLLNTTGNFNTATGAFALLNNSTGSNNTASGFQALKFNTTGTNNTANGFRALVRNTTGNDNIALGNNAGENLTTGNNNIDIFDRGVVGEANTIRIGKQGTQRTTFIAGISGATVTGTAVVVDSNGQLGVAPSSQRFKQNVQAMGDASDILLALHPVTFEYKPDVDPKGIPQFGL